MRKLRRLPWRIPKSHHSQPTATDVPVCAHAETERETPRRESWRDAIHEQPVAFAGGRYVAPKVTRPAEIRRKARHRTILPVPAAG